MTEYEAAPLLLQRLEELLAIATNSAATDSERNRVINEAHETIALVKGN